MEASNEHLSLPHSHQTPQHAFIPASGHEALSPLTFQMLPWPIQKWPVRLCFKAKEWK